MAVHQCTQAEKDAGAEAARQVVGNTESYAPVWIYIVSVQGSQVTFRAQGATRDLTIAWTPVNVWPSCPTQWQAVPAVSDSGVAYLTAAAYDLLDGGAKQYARLKWPRYEDAEGLYQAISTTHREVTIGVEQLLLVGMRRSDGILVALDLLAAGVPGAVVDLAQFFTPIQMQQAGAASIVVEIQALSLQLVATVSFGNRKFFTQLDLRDHLTAHPRQAITLPMTVGGDMAVVLTPTGASRIGISWGNP